MFGSASVAEEVCHLNRWDQCSLPINALETALELRQLDTLAFFLRSRDNGKFCATYLYQWAADQHTHNRYCKFCATYLHQWAADQHTHSRYCKFCATYLHQWAADQHTHYR